MIATGKHPSYNPALPSFPNGGFLSMKRSRAVLLVCLAFVLGLLVSCGGGGGGTGTVLAQGPPTNPTPAILTGFCSTITTGRNNFVFGLGNVQDPTCFIGGVAFGVPMPSGGTLKNLQLVAELQGSPGATDTGSVTVLVNGTDTSLTCTASAVVAGSAEAKCSDNQHTVTVNASDQVAAVIVMQTGAFQLTRVAFEKQ